MSTKDGRQEAMQKLADELRDLRQSPLYPLRSEQGYKPVLGEGSLDAPVIFIGEAPGKKEAETGQPFVGASGKVLSQLLAAIGLQREDVYITNIVKDRPPENRDPHPEEIALYAPLLRKQLEIIRPKVIATLGRFAMEFIIEQYGLPLQGQKIGDLHGKPIEIESEAGQITFIPLYHPAVALYNRDQRETLEADFQTLQKFL